MVCRFLDGFDYYTSSEITRKWTSVAGVIIGSSVFRNGTQALHFQFGQFIDKSLDDQASWVVGLGFRTTTTAADVDIVQFRDVATTQATLRMNIGGTLEVVRGTTTSVTDGLSVLTVSANTWYYIEIKITISDSIGASTCVVRVNESDWLTVATGQDLKVTANATADIIRLGATSGVFHADDLYIFDGTGSKNNDFAGDVKVTTLYADGNGATSNFVGSDADSTDNYLHVDEALTDDDSSYVESSTTSDIDLYTFDNLPETPDTIHVVQVNNVVKKDDVGTRTMRSVIRPVSTDIFGTSIAPSAGSYTNEIEIYDDDPEISGTWTETNLNATEFGIEIET